MIPIEEIAAMSESEYIGYIFRKTKARNMSVPDFQVGNRVVSSEMYYFESSPPEKIIGQIVELSINADKEYFAKVKWKTGEEKWYFRAELKRINHCIGCGCNPCDCNWGTDE